MYWAEPSPSIREPRGKREPPGLDGLGGEADHLVVHGGVVQVGDGQGHRAQAPQVPGHDHGDGEEGGAGKQAGPRGAGCRLEQVPQVQADLAPQVVAARMPRCPLAGPALGMTGNVTHSASSAGRPRRTDEEHRLVYLVDGNEVVIIPARTHYGK